MDILPKVTIFFEESNIAESLERIYNQVPGGNCLASTNCCSESVNTFYAEFVNMYINLRESGNLDEFSKRAVKYYLTELVLPQKCPMLQDDGRCVCYAARPLPCRIFGHLLKEDYEENYEAVLEQNLSAAEELKEQFDIIVPDEVSRHKVEWCPNFKSENPMNADDRDDLVDMLFSIDGRFLMEGMLNPEDINLHMVQWFAYAALGRERAQELRIKVSQEISKTGESATLDDVMGEL